MANKLTEVDAAQRQIKTEQAWIEQCGGNLLGYIIHYGSADDPSHYGDGGELIYQADVAALRRAEARLDAAVAQIRRRK